jgi:hypothetical protein
MTGGEWKFQADVWTRFVILSSWKKVKGHKDGVRLIFNCFSKHRVHKSEQK